MSVICPKCGYDTGVTSLDEEVEYWIKEKGLESKLTKKEKEKVIEEMISRWDALADEEIIDVAEEVTGKDFSKLMETV